MLDHEVAERALNRRTNLCQLRSPRPPSEPVQRFEDGVLCLREVPESREDAPVFAARRELTIGDRALLGAVGSTAALLDAREGHIDERTVRGAHVHVMRGLPVEPAQGVVGERVDLERESWGNGAAVGAAGRVAGARRHAFSPGQVQPGRATKRMSLVCSFPVNATRLPAAVAFLFTACRSADTRAEVSQVSAPP
jgi:hypothetical protein